MARLTVYASDAAEASNVVSYVASLLGVSEAEFDQNVQIGASPPYNPLNETNINLAETFIPLKSPDGSLISTRAVSIWLPPKDVPVKGNVILFHGYGEASSRYLSVACYLNKNGYRVFGLDHSFHGNNTNNVGYKIKEIQNFTVLYEDAFAFCNFISAQTSETEPLFFLGHSMGGLITFKTLLSVQGSLSTDEKLAKQFKGAVLSGPCFYIYGNDLLSVYWTPVKRFGSFMSYYFPTFKFPGASLSLLTHDKLIQKATKADKRCFGDATSAKFLNCFIAATESVFKIDKVSKQSEFEKLKVPFLVIQGRGDKVVDPIGAIALFDKSSTKKEDKEIIMIPKCYHEILNEPKIRDEMLVKIVSWFEAKL